MSGFYSAAAISAEIFDVAYIRAPLRPQTSHGDALLQEIYRLDGNRQVRVSSNALA